MPRVLTRSVVVFVSVAAVSFAQGTTSTTPAPGESTGTRIGTIIKTAISTALPGVTDLISAIWGNRKPNDSIKKSDLDTAVKQAHDKFFADAQSKLKDTALVSAQLGVLNQFVDGSVTANERVNLILGRLSNSSVSDDQYKLIKRDWTVANDFLSRIGKISDADLGKVKEITLSTQLKQIRDIASKNSPDVAFSVDNKNYSDLKGQLQGVSQLLDGITNTVTVQLSMLQDDMADVAKWASGAAGPAASPYSARTNSLLANNAKSIGDARKILKK